MLLCYCISYTFSFCNSSAAPVYSKIILRVVSYSEEASSSDREDLLAELEIMKKLKPHPHVVSLIGAVRNEGQYSVNIGIILRGVVFLLCMHVRSNFF